MPDITPARSTASRKQATRRGLGSTLGDAVRRIARIARDAETSNGPHNVVGAINVGGEGRVNAVQRQQVVRVRRRPEGTSAKSVTEVAPETRDDDA